MLSKRAPPGVPLALLVTVYSTAEMDLRRARKISKRKKIKLLETMDRCVCVNMEMVKLLIWPLIFQLRKEGKWKNCQILALTVQILETTL